MGLQLLTDGSQDSLVQIPDILIEAIDGIVTLILSRTLIPDGQNQALDGVRHGLGVGG